MKPVFIDGFTLKPLPMQFQGAACAKCGKLQGRWVITVPSQEPLTVCSLCIMYEYPWGKRNKVDLEELVKHIEKELGKELPKNESGELRSCGDADRIVAAIAITSRVNFLRKKKEFFLG